MIYNMITVNSYELDEQQLNIVKDNSKNLLVVAGAGSGKTLTILGKIKYLILEQNILPDEILCVTFTNAAAKSLSEKIKKEMGFSVDTYTFHKLSMNILNKVDYSLADSNLLDDIVHKFFFIDLLDNNKYMNLVLKYFNIYERNIGKVYKNLLYSKEFNKLENTIITFIHLFKCNGFSLNDFNKFIKDIRKITNIFNYKKEKIFLTLALNIYVIYSNYLNENNEMDFDDLIIKATSYVKAYGIGKLKYIIIDEYQDTSFVRFNLIKEIILKTGAKLMVVGDDYQSIYRFTGCDLSLFLDFDKYFNDAKIMKIETTYRNSQELVDIAGSFVMKNKRQIKKIMKSNKHLDNPIEIVYYKDIKSKFVEILDKIISDSNDSILVLGRNNNDVNMILGEDFKLIDNLYLKSDKYKDIDIRYMTFHKSKGLESDNVILINMVDDILGFPSKIEDEQILRLVTKKSDGYPFSEERRLFYVALTRTKNKVYIMSPKKNMSCFVCELKRYGIK